MSSLELESYRVGESTRIQEDGGARLGGDLGNLYRPPKPLSYCVTSAQLRFSSKASTNAFDENLNWAEPKFSGGLFSFKSVFSTLRPQK